MLDQEDIYAQKKQKIERFTINFIGRTTEKHESIVTGIDFKSNVIASCGLDQKLKIWSLKS
jgi:WD40 repeat protein